MQERIPQTEREINRDLLRPIITTPLWFWVAVVVLGGLATSTFLDSAIGPTLFLKFTGRSGERVARRKAQARVEENFLA